MNNLLLGLFLLSSGTVVLVSQHLTLQTTRAANRQLAADHAQAALEAQQTALALSDAQATLANRRQEPAQVAKAATAQAQAFKAASPKLVDPAGEGVWPTGKPYFYLPKNRLGTLGFSTLSAEETSSAEARTVLGLLAEEKAAVDQALQGYYERLHQLQVTHARHQDAAPGVNHANHQETTYRIPAMRAEIEPLGEDLKTAWISAVGATRAQLLWDRFRPGPTGPNEDVETCVTYYADRKEDGTVAHFVTETQGAGQGGGGVSFPVVPGSLLWKWRHLFGEEPLIPL